MQITDFGAYIEDLCLNTLADAEDFVEVYDITGLRILVDKEFIIAAHKFLQQEKQ